MESTKKVKEQVRHSLEWRHCSPCKSFDWLMNKVEFEPKTGTIYLALWYSWSSVCRLVAQDWPCLTCQWRQPAQQRDSPLFTYNTVLCLCVCLAQQTDRRLVGVVGRNCGKQPRGRNQLKRARSNSPSRSWKESTRHTQERIHSIVVETGDVWEKKKKKKTEFQQLDHEKAIV